METEKKQPPAKTVQAKLYGAAALCLLGIFTVYYAPFVAVYGLWQPVRIAGYCLILGAVIVAMRTALRLKATGARGKALCGAAMTVFIMLGGWVWIVEMLRLHND